MNRWLCGMMNKQMAAAKHVIEQLEQAGYEAVFVGGAVRDALLQRPFHDVDVATNALPLEVKAIFKKTIDVGIEHGTVLVLVGDEGVEVTTYRTESTYTDHRRPDAVLFVRHLKDDLQRRDFTMNALAMRANGDMIDYYNGQQDIDNKLIRAVGNATARFSEDALRMLRAVRFSAQLGFTIEAQTFDAITQQAANIQKIAIERVQAELEKLFVARYVATGIDMLHKSGLAQHIKGRFDAAEWCDVCIEDAMLGWAYLAYVSHMTAAELAQYYRLSKKQKQFIEAVLYLVAKRSWSDMDYFKYDEQSLLAAQQILQWQHVHVVDAQYIVLTKQALPIQHKAQLVVNGQHLMEWSNKARGPWIKEALSSMLEAVVTKQVPNEIQQLKEWFSREWNN